MAAKSVGKREAERLSKENDRQADKFSIRDIAELAGVSKKTVVAFRNQQVTRPESARKIAEALEKLKRGLTPADKKGPLKLDDGKTWKGTTTVEAMTKGKVCGWCRKYHKTSLSCPV